MVLVVFALLTLVAAPLSAQTCTGDCNGTGIVTVDELVRGVNIALERAELDECPVFDADSSGRVEIYELVEAVGNALTTCEAGVGGGPTKSGPIATNGTHVVAANTDTDTVTIFDVGDNGTLTKVKELALGIEPRSVAILSNKPWAYIANTVSGTVSVITLDTCQVLADITVGTEPWAVAASPNGTYVYVANANSNSVSVIDTVTNAVFATVAVGRSPRALAVTSDGDDDDRDEKLYVPNFYARPASGFVPPSTAMLGGTDGAQAALPSGSNGQMVVGEGIFDDARQGAVDVISTGSNMVIDTITLSALPNTGFNVARGGFVNTTPGDGPRTIFADGATDGTVAQATGAFPNMLMSVAILGNRAFFPSSAASPEPPLRFNANVQSLLSVIDTVVDQETPDTFNMNRGINFDLPAGLLDAQVRDNTDRMFPSAPVDIDCSTGGTQACWVVSQGSDFIVRVDGVAGGGTPTINAPTAAGGVDPSPVVRIYTIDPQNALISGRNPRGIALGFNGTRAYVSCPTTRDVIVMDLVNRTVLQRVQSSPLPPAGSIEETIRRGKIDFFTSRPFWSDRGWGGCWSCHPDGRTDTVTWAFEAGPRQTIALDGTFNKRDPEDHRALNWTPVRDENQDFELNTRGVFGGRGFIAVNMDLNGDGLMPDSDPNVRNFGPASSGRAQQQEDITAFIQLGIRSPLAPPPATGNVTRGRDVFGTAAPGGANCVACHSGGKWTTSRITYDQGDVNPVPGTDTGIVNIPPIDLDGDTTIDASEERAVSVYLNGFNTTAGAGRICEVPPPLPGVDVGATQAAERIRIMRQLGTFTGSNPIEVRGNAISPVNATAPALAVVAAFGADGFNPPSLLGVFDSAPYFHHGAAATLEEAFGVGTKAEFLAAAQAHWRSGTGGQANILDSDATAVTDLIAFVRSIDSRTAPFPAADLAPNDPVFADASAVCDCQKEPPLGTPALDCRL